MLTANTKPANKNTGMLHLNYTLQEGYNEVDSKHEK